MNRFRKKTLNDLYQSNQSDSINPHNNLPDFESITFNYSALSDNDNNSLKTTNQMFGLDMIKPIVRNLASSPTRPLEQEDLLDFLEHYGLTDGKDESATVYTNSHRTYTTASSQSYSSQSYCDSIDSSIQSYVISDAFTIPANEYDENHTMKRPKLIQSYLNSSFSVSNNSEPCNFSMGSFSTRPAPMLSKQNLRVPGTQKIPRFSLPPQKPIYPSPLTSSSFNRYCDIPQKSVEPQVRQRVMPTPSEDEMRLSQFRPRPKATVNLPPPMPVRLSPQIIPEPIHTEVRLDYIRLYVNAMNSLDRQVFAQYVDRYIHPNCVIQISNIKQSYPRQNHRFIINVVGKQFLISMYDLILKKYPDFCYRIMNDKTESQILRANSMLLSSHVKLEGVDPMASFKQITCPSVSDSPVSLMFTNYTFNTFVDYSFENTKFTFDGTKSVYIDAAGLITAMTLS